MHAEHLQISYTFHAFAIFGPLYSPTIASHTILKKILIYYPSFSTKYMFY